MFLDRFDAAEKLVPHFEKLHSYADDSICLQTPEHFLSVGQFYAHFDQVDDKKAITLLHEPN